MLRPPAVIKPVLKPVVPPPKTFTYHMMNLPPSQSKPEAPEPKVIITERVHAFMHNGESKVKKEPDKFERRNRHAKRTG